jgi:hypothetical protein
MSDNNEDQEKKLRRESTDEFCKRLGIIQHKGERREARSSRPTMGGTFLPRQSGTAIAPQTRRGRSSLAYSAGRIVRLANSPNWGVQIRRRGQRYCRALRKVASDILELPDDGSRYDARGSGRSDWLEQVDAVKLSDFTASRVAEWKKAFLSRALPDPVSQRHVRRSGKISASILCEHRQ